MGLLIILVVRCFQCLPEAIAIRLGLVLGWALRYVFRHRLATVRNQVEVALGPEFSGAEREKLIRGIYRHLGLLLVELLRLPRVQPDRLLEKVVFHGEEHLQAALAEGRGVLFLCGHVGNWELIPIGLVAKGYRIGLLVKELKTAAGELFLQMLRHDNGVFTIGRRGSARQILKALKDNCMLGFVLDQNMTEDEGVFVDFFGQPACTMKGLAVLAEHSGAAVLPACTYRDADRRRHHFVISPPVEMEFPHDDKEANVLHNTARFSLILEETIRRNPDQWIWVHKRWKTRPANESECPFAYVAASPQPSQQEEEAT